MEDKREMICSRCKKAAPVSNVRFALKGDERIAVCSDCVAKASVQEYAHGRGQENKKGYYCSRCNYKFSFDPKSQTALRCPYCGKADSVSEHKPVLADDLLEESG